MLQKSNRKFKSLDGFFNENLSFAKFKKIKILILKE